MEGETIHERLWTQKQTEGFGRDGGGVWGGTGGGYKGQVLYGALGVVHKQ